MNTMIETPRLLIRPVVDGDLSAYRAILGQPVMAAANGSPSPATVADLDRWFDDDRQSPHSFAVVDRTTQRFMGMILYYQHQDAHGPVPWHYDLGYFLDPRDWGHGLMPEGVSASFDLVRQTSDQPQVIWGSCLRTNDRSRRVLEKLGLHLVSDPTELPASAPNEWWFRRTI